MERKQTFAAIIVLLSLAFVITLVGWIRARNELIKIKDSGGELAAKENALSVCDNIKSSSDEQACVDQLMKISSLLSKYEEKIKNIRVPAR